MTLTKEALQTHKQETLRISLLGKFSLQIGETAVLLETPRYQSLLAFLVFHRQQAHSRQELAFKFWPDSSESQARTNLRKALYTIRQILPRANCFITAERQHVQWRVDAPCQVDVWQFETAVAQSEKAATALARQTCLEQAITAYHEDLLPDHYDDWVLAIREKLRFQYLTALEDLLLLHENQRRYQDAIHIAQTLLLEDPLHEAASRRLMRLQSLAGNVAGALRTYHNCSTRLQRELGVFPSRATQETYERLLKIETPGELPQPARVPLVARKQAWKALQTSWGQATRRKPQVVLLTGEAGIGKTRMAEELLDWTRRQGFTTITAVCYAAEGQLPYAPVADWLRSDEFQTVIGDVPDKWIIECGRLLPELLVQHLDLPSPTPLTESWQRQHFFTALAQTILTAPQPILLFIDDLQWCDQDTLDWLHFLLRMDTEVRLLLLGTVRLEELSPEHPLILWQQFLQRDSSLTEISLSRLDADATCKLAEQILQVSLSIDQGAYLYAETEGVPLFIVETVRAGLYFLESKELPFTSNRLPNNSQLPPRVQNVIEIRLSQLSPQARELTSVAATIGRSFNFDLLAEICDDEEEIIVRGLDELWHKRIVREQGLDTYDFCHDKIRQVAYESLSLPRKRQIHQRLWQALETHHINNLDLVSGQIAFHCQEARQFQKAINYYQKAAQMAHEVYSNKDSSDYLQRAIDLFPETSVDSQQQIEIFDQLGDILKWLGRFKDAEAAFLRAIALTTDSWKLTRLYQAIAGAQGMQSRFEQAFISLKAAEEALQQLPQNLQENWWYEWLNIKLKYLDLYYFSGQVEEMAQLGKVIQPNLTKYGSPVQQVHYLRFLTKLSVVQERYALSKETVAHAETVCSAAEDLDLMDLIANCRFDLARANLWFGWKGNLDTAEQLFEETLNPAEEMENVHLRARCLNYLVLVHRRLGNTKQVSKLLPEALSAAKKCNFNTYIATIEANMAWLKWKGGELETAKSHGLKALEIWQSLSRVISFQWLSLWVLVDIATAQNEIEKAVLYASSLLHPKQARLPQNITAVLQQAIPAWENDRPDATIACLREAVELAQTYNYL